MKNHIITYILILVVIAILLIGTCRQPKKEPPNTTFYSHTTVYIPDTIRKGVFYIQDSVNLPYKISPKTVTIYKTLPSKGEIRCNVDSLLVIIDSLQHFYVNNSFLTTFTSSPKLLSAKFTKNKFNISLLALGGKVINLDYPVNMDQYIYEFKNNQLSADILKRPPFFKRFSYNVYGYAGYEVFSTKPLLSLEGNLDYERIRLNASLSSTIWLKPEAFGFIRLGYKLK